MNIFGPDAKLSASPQALASRTPALRCPSCRDIVYSTTKQATMMYVTCPISGEKPYDVFAAAPCGCRIHHFWAQRFQYEIERRYKGHTAAEVVVPKELVEIERTRLTARLSQLHALSSDASVSPPRRSAAVEWKLTIADQLQRLFPGTDNLKPEHYGVPKAALKSYAASKAVCKAASGAKAAYAEPKGMFANAWSPEYKPAEPFNEKGSILKSPEGRYAVLWGLTTKVFTDRSDAEDYLAGLRDEDKSLWTTMTLNPVEMLKSYQAAANAGFASSDGLLKKLGIFDGEQQKVPVEVPAPVPVPPPPPPIDKAAKRKRTIRRLSDS